MITDIMTTDIMTMDITIMSINMNTIIIMTATIMDIRTTMNTTKQRIRLSTKKLRRTCWIMKRDTKLNNTLTNIMIMIITITVTAQKVTLMSMLLSYMSWEIC